MINLDTVIYIKKTGKNSFDYDCGGVLLFCLSLNDLRLLFPEALPFDSYRSFQKRCKAVYKDRLFQFD